MSRRRTAVVAVLLAFAGAAPASAADLARGVSDGAYFDSPDPAVRALGLARAKRAGARFVRVQLAWRTVDRGEMTTPEQARDPAWRGYRFGRVDATIREVVAAGLEPLVVVARAPDRFEAPGRWRFATAGTWAPSPAAFADFAAAAAQRYSGRYPDPTRAGSPLPRVRHWQAWNEPNLPRYLQPQWIAQDGRWLPYAPGHYRRMLVAFEAAVRARTPDAVVVTAGTSPIGDRDGTARMAPVRFWQSFFCLGRPPGLTPVPCPRPARFDVFAHHPFSVGDPDTARRPSQDVSVADLHRLTRILRVAERTGRARGARRHPIWVTELNWDSRPPDPQGLPPRRQHRYVARALYRLWAAGVRVAFWHFITDRADLPSHPAGLWSRDPRGFAFDRPKPALRAFRFPFVAVRVSSRRVRVWGLTPSAGARRVTIERRRRGGWRRIGSARVSPAGVIRGRATVRGRALLRARAGREASAGWRG